MHRSLLKAERLSCSAGTIDNGLLHLGGETRGSHVDRLLEEGAVERVRFIEHRQGLEHSLCE